MSRGDRRMVEPARPESYYGRPILKEPVWSWEVPLYLFTGGLAGASAGLGFAARLAGNDELARRAWTVGLGAVSVSPLLLISDLGRPGRFINMMRVFKPASPMNMGSWVLLGAGSATGVAAAHATLGWFPRTVGRAAEATAAVLGLPLCTYTAALVADTAVPLWHEARHELPFVFGGSAMATAGAAATIVTPVDSASPARRLTLIGALVESAASQVMERRLGDLAVPYREGSSGRISTAAKTLTTAGALLTGFGGRADRRLALGGAAAVLAGSLLVRWSVFRAGFESARLPEYTVKPQRERLAARLGDAASRLNGGASERAHLHAEA